ncbi:uncharacterized protein G2W53_005719 [Senna tora]|uniref:Uncharacterized protein n=1 Tax=Senna tora TaxID=362788 RepID=A0A834X433_9FABA|nr:uncharacterized protein G2W53_005719 [Senna tora]
MGSGLMVTAAAVVEVAAIMVVAGTK